jgi:hypothetical protein
MQINLFRKRLVILIISLFIGASLMPIISGVSINKNISIVNELGKNQDTSPVTFYAFDKKYSKECSSYLSEDVVEEITGMIEELKYKLVYEPFSEVTYALKSDFVKLLDVQGLLPVDMSRDKVLSLLNPFWLRWFDRGTGLMSKSLFVDGVNNVFNGLGVLQRFFLSPGIVDFLGGSPRPGAAASSLFCSVASGGQGIPFPLFLLPRPRGFVVWGGREICGTNVGNLLSGRGFIAVGPQSGVALGFIGVGLTYSAFGSTYYAFIGYSTFVYVNAYSIEWFAPPNAKPVISDESPVDGAIDVPLSLPELSFRISDADGDRMDYSVSTSPNIGSGSGSFKKNGVYSVPVSGLEGNTEYSWHVVVNDEYDSVEKTFSFTTEMIAPVVSDPFPVDGDGWVPVDISELSFRLKDFQGDLMDYTVETSPNVGSGSGNGVGDGVYSVDVDGLDYTTVYSWFVNVTDGEHWTRESYSFKTQPIMVFDPFDIGWLYRKKVTIDHDLVDGDLSDFPVLVSVVDGDLGDKAQEDGDDILFMDGSGVANRLFHEIELYDDSDGELVAWVKVSELEGDVDTVLYVYYGNPSCDSQEYSDFVWDENFCSVWHLDDLKDSSNNDNDGTNHGTDIIGGKIGFARNFIESQNDYIDWGDMPEPADGSINKATFEAWVKPGDSYYGGWPFQKANSGDYEPDKLSYVLSLAHNGKIGFNVLPGTWYPARNRIYFTSDDTHIVIGSWQHVVVVVDLPSQNMDIYYNGEEIDSTRTIEGTPPTYFYDIDLSEKSGRSIDESNDKYYDGDFDELRISKICRSSGWISTGYNNQNDPLSFMSFGPEETGP